MSLHLKNVKNSDKGSYTCVVSFDNQYHDVLIELEVAGWRQSFHSVNKVIDVGTAHPNFSVAEDRKSFRHNSQAQKVTQNEGRFDSAVCVLGSEGFSSGKHYWEVEVEKSNDWDLGVARKSIQRKGIISLSLKEGFWALGSSLKDYWDT
nr:PREDICTED: vespryn-like [Struthio camelus australis]